MTENKYTVIEALVRRFAGYDTTTQEEKLIRASCENVYQSGYLQGRHDALQESLKACKGEDVNNGK